jgi:hypothetical protein
MQARKFALIGTLILAGFATTAFGQAPPPPPASPTLWSFLGIPQASYKIHAQLFNRRGNHPRLEKKPPLKGIADPANLKSDVPAIKAAAEIKQAEDLKPQKIKAIKFLATIGCGCYDKDKKITKALLAAMDDCTEDVRLAAVQAISEAASSNACEHCGQNSCCNEDITNQLYKIAYELDDLGCPVEPSERVREAAIEALRICCPSRLPVQEVAPVPVEGADRPAPIEGVDPNRVPPPPTPAVPVPPTPAVPQPPAAANENRAAQVDPNNFLREAALREARRPMPTMTPPSSRRTARLHPISLPAPAELTRPPANQVGVLSLFDARRNVAHVHFQDSSFQPVVGSRLQIYLPGYDGPQLVGELEVIESFAGSANVRPPEGLDIVRIGRQAQVVATMR